MKREVKKGLEGMDDLFVKPHPEDAFHHCRDVDGDWPPLVHRVAQFAFEDTILLLYEPVEVVNGLLLRHVIERAELSMPPAKTRILAISKFMRFEPLSHLEQT